jgi:hypothetical protein
MITRYDLQNETIAPSPKGTFVNYNELVITLAKKRMATPEGPIRDAIDRVLAEVILADVTA